MINNIKTVHKNQSKYEETISDTEPKIKFGDENHWKLGYNLFMIISYPIPSNKAVDFYKNLVIKGYHYHYLLLYLSISYIYIYSLYYSIPYLFD